MRKQCGNRLVSLKRRSGFTLVELLVAAAMCMLIMAILSTAFSKAIDTFRYMRSVGNMQEQLRMAAVVIKKDLSAPHFAGEFQQNLSGPNLSDQRQDQPGWTPPAQGYFSLGGGTVIAEPFGSPAVDGDGLPSTRGTGFQMAMTVLLSGMNPQQQFYAQSNALLAATNPDYSPVFAAPTAQVIYFTQASGQSAGGTPLFTLYRHQQIVLPTRPAAAAVAGNSEVSAFSLSDVASNQPGSRLQPAPLQGANQGSDILLTNVLSFEIKAHWWVSNGQGTSVEGTPSFGNGNADYPFAPLTYDSNQYSGKRIDAIQIKIRIWDSKAQQARQITIMQDM